MTAIEKLQNKLNIQIDETYTIWHDLEISTRATADGYDVYTIKSTPYDDGLDWENDVFYYQPSFDDVMTRILELDDFAKVYVDDIEEYLPEYEIERWINDNEDTDD
jgi:hypothetical protein